MSSPRRAGRRLPRQPRARRRSGRRQDLIAAQVELIKKADVAGVKAGLTKRLQDKVTEAQVKKAGEQVGKMTIDDLVASVAAGKDSLKIN